MLPGYELPSRTRLICRLLKWFTVGIAIFSLFMLFQSDAINVRIDRYWDALSEAQQAAIVYTNFKKSALTLIAIFAQTAILLPIFGAYHLFAQLQKGTAFSLRVTKAIRFMGQSLIIWTVMLLWVHPMMIGALTYDLPKGENLRTFSFVFYTRHAQMLTFGALFLIIGQIFTEAVQISDENRQIV